MRGPLACLHTSFLAHITLCKFPNLCSTSCISPHMLPDLTPVVFFWHLHTVPELHHHPLHAIPDLHGTSCTLPKGTFPIHIIYPACNSQLVCHLSHTSVTLHIPFLTSTINLQDVSKIWDPRLPKKWNLGILWLLQCFWWLLYYWAAPMATCSSFSGFCDSFPVVLAIPRPSTTQQQPLTCQLGRRKRKKQIQRPNITFGRDAGRYLPDSLEYKEEMNSTVRLPRFMSL